MPPYSSEVLVALRNTVTVALHQRGTAIRTEDKTELGLKKADPPDRSAREMAAM